MLNKTAQVFMLAGLFIAAASATGLGASDSCAAKAPPALAGAVAKAFPKHRLPLASDSSKEDIEFDIKEGGDGCLRIASGNFEGNKELDFAFILTPKKEGSASLVVALAKKGKRFDFKILRDWGTPERLYVKTTAPGAYKRTGTLEGRVSEPGEVVEIETKLPGILSGGIESSGVVYALKNGKWLHVWVLD